MKIDVRYLAQDLKTDFYSVHNEKCSGGWCFCAAWVVPTWEGFGERTADENRAVREDLFARGIYDGYLVYFDGVPSGWVQAGPRDAFPKLLGRFELEKDPSVWAITCMAIAPEYHGQGLAHEIIHMVMEDLKIRGIERVQAFPKAGEGLSKEELWTGPLSVFEKAGFMVVKQVDQRPVLERLL